MSVASTSGATHAKIAATIATVSACFDRVELVALLLVARHEAGAFERLALAVLLRGARLTGAKTVQADAPGERISAERADLDLFQVERGVLLELLVDDVLKLQ